MKTWIKYLLCGLSIIVIVIAVVFWIALNNHYRGIEQVEKEYQAYDPPSLADFGSTSQLSILPLINWHTADAGLKTEMGVSYLVKTDSVTILFDVGHNQDEQDPSPLQYNMEQLDIRLSSIDMLFLSHDHFDHVGGQQWVDNGSFSLGNKQVDLVGKEVFTPVPKTYPGIQPLYIPDPTVLATGVATTGTIPRKLFIGRIDEHSLAINVKGKGLVLIVGCGHQTLPRLVERTEAVFNIPIYGIIGDLHYPVPEGRINLLGLNAQRLLASGEGPFNPLTKKQVMQNVEMLKSREIGVIGIGGHDSSDEIIEEFHQSFGSKYRFIKVGQWIEIGTKDTVRQDASLN